MKEKFLFVAVNAKYVHTCLAVRYLKNSIKSPSIVKEYTINDDINRVCAEIFKTGIKNILFSIGLFAKSSVTFLRV